MAGIYQLYVRIEGIEPKIWRRFKVNDSYTLKDLGNVINYMFDWYGIHLSEFKINDKAYGMIHPGSDKSANINSEEYKLRDLNLSKGSKFTYIYDFGDWWEHIIEIESYEKGAGLLYPVCLDGERNAPPEDCGGLPGYSMLLQVLKNKDHPDREMFMNFLEDNWDPEEFDVDILNTLIRDPNLGVIIEPNDNN